MKILLVTSQEGIQKRLNLQFPDVEWLSFNYGRSEYDGLDAVLVLEPYECLGKNERAQEPERGGLYTSIFVLWKRFIAFHYPNIKLLVGGFASTRHPNYVNLIDLSGQEDFAAVIDSAEPVISDWENEIPPRGENVLDKLKLFFEGHHKEGIIITMAKVRQGLNHAYYDYGAREVRLGKFKRIWLKVLLPIRNYARLMQRRWENYAPFFENMPFYYQLEEVNINGYLDELGELVKGRRELTDQQLKEKQQKFIEFDGFNRLDQIQQVLDLANKRYITQEVVGQILVIDDDPAFHADLDYSFPVFRFDHVYSGKEALTKVVEKNYGLILLDLQLNRDVDELTGLNYVSSLKNMKPDIPLVIVTTHAHPKVYAEAIKSGADNFLVKNEFNIQQWENIFIRTISGKSVELMPLPEVNKPPAIEQTDGMAQVLVVEDDEDWFERIKAVNDDNIQFHLATTQRVALDTIRDSSYNFDLILLDLYLREDDRKEVSGGLRLIPTINKEKPLIPIIVISRDWTYSMTLMAINHGATDYLRKDQFNVILWYNRFKNYIELKKNRELVEKMKNL